MRHLAGLPAGMTFPAALHLAGRLTWYWYWYLRRCSRRAGPRERGRRTPLDEIVAMVAELL